MGPAGMGSIQVGGVDTGIYAVLTASTVAGLEEAFRLCLNDGVAFTFRTYEPSSQQVVSLVITNATITKFGYKLGDVDTEQRDQITRDFVNAALDGGAISVTLPAE